MANEIQYQSSLTELESKFKKDWSHIREAREAAFRKREEITSAIRASGQTFFSGDTSLVVFGSLAREEWTEQSDLDWGYLIDGQAHPEHLTVAQSIAILFEEHKLGEPPGPTGVFGNLIFSHELVHQIGGESDTNSNTTRRLLLLLESRSIGRHDAYARVMRVILERYFENDEKMFDRERSRFRVPRFLLNDVVRFWRTMAVDFATKQRERAGVGWALRNVKLRMSRKLIFVSGLLICFRCHLRNLSIIYDIPEKPAGALIEYVSTYANQTPLEILADALMDYNISEETVCDLLDSYDAFLECLNNVDHREILKNLSLEASKDDKVFQQMRKIGHRFQHGLDKLFFVENEELRNLIQKYGVF